MVEAVRGASCPSGRKFGAGHSSDRPYVHDWRDRAETLFCDISSEDTFGAVRYARTAACWSRQTLHLLMVSEDGTVESDRGYVIESICAQLGQAGMCIRGEDVADGGESRLSHHI